MIADSEGALTTVPSGMKIYDATLTQVGAAGYGATWPNHKTQPGMMYYHTGAAVTPEAIIAAQIVWGPYWALANIWFGSGSNSQGPAPKPSDDERPSFRAPSAPMLMAAE